MITAQDVMEKWNEIREEDERILFIVGGPGSGKSQVIRELAENDKWKYLEARELLNEEFLEIDRAERPKVAYDIICDALKACHSEVALIDNVDVLFAPILNLEPIELLRLVNKAYPIIVGWKGEFDGTQLHLEHNNNPHYYSFTVTDKDHVIELK